MAEPVDNRTTDGQAVPDTSLIESVLKGLGLSFVHRRFPDSVRDPAQLALRLQAGVRQIARTLVLKGRRSGRGYLVVICGRNQISLRKLMLAAGEELERPDDAFMRTEVGYPADGVPPFGFRGHLLVLVDSDLMTCHNAWFPAGSANSWMFLRTDLMVEAAQARILSLKITDTAKVRIG